MDNIEYIENYFRGNKDASDKEAFEKKIMEDSEFAEEVAFYISANGVIQQKVQQERKQRLREIYDEQKVISIKRPVRNIWKYMAAASVLIAVILITWFFSGNKNSPQQLADKYALENFQTFGVTMSSNPDSIQAGLNLFNSNKLTESLNMFETIAKNNPENSDAKKYAGIVSLRLKNYDKAIEYFTILGADTSLYSNPGKFYKAITLLERSKLGDKNAAKLLLEQVRDENLEGKSKAGEWLKKF
ncbi:MAG: hypothetical protein ACRDE8_08000 [Ginsengibacter sp.]